MPDDRRAVDHLLAVGLQSASAMAVVVGLRGAALGWLRLLEDAGPDADERELAGRLPRSHLPPASR